MLLRLSWGLWWRVLLGVCGWRGGGEGAPSRCPLRGCPRPRRGRRPAGTGGSTRRPGPRPRPPTRRASAPPPLTWRRGGGGAGGGDRGRPQRRGAGLRATGGGGHCSGEMVFVVARRPRQSFQRKGRAHWPGTPQAVSPTSSSEGTATGCAIFSLSTERGPRPTMTSKRLTKSSTEIQKHVGSAAPRGRK